MIKLRRLAFLALLSVFLSVPGCSWFSKHPVIPAVVTCSGETIQLPLVTKVYDDVMSDNWLDLATNVVPLLKDGYADLQCIWNYLGVSNPETLPHINAMKAAHASDLKGSTASLGCTQTKGVRPALPGAAETVGTPAGAREGEMSPPAAIFKANPGDRLLGASPVAGGAPRVPAAGPKGYSYPGPSVDAEQKNCFRECGDNVDSIAPPGGCRCWRHVGSTWRWVAAR